MFTSPSPYGTQIPQIGTSPIGSIPGPVPGMTQGMLMNVLGQHPRPSNNPPIAAINIYQQLKANPNLVQTIIQQRPQSVVELTKIMQGSDIFRNDDSRDLSPFCYFNWSLVFTFTGDIFLMYPVANFFGFVVGYCFNVGVTPCFIPNFQIVLCFPL